MEVFRMKMLVECVGVRGRSEAGGGRPGEALERVASDGEESGAVVGEGGRDVVTEVERTRVDIMKSRILDQRVGILLESPCHSALIGAKIMLRKNFEVI
jgi:hypothetical protein